MIDLSDLGLEPETSAATQAADATVVSNDRDPKGLVPGSVKARMLYSAFSRQPVIVVDSPPGAGKTTLIVEVIETLLRRSDFTIVIATPTKRGGADLAERLVAEIGTEKDKPAVVLSIKGIDRPEGTYADKPTTRDRHVVIRTVSSCTYSAPNCDVMVFDEAYQSTYADVMAAADAADQVIMVGDPGQIGPVVTQDTSAWQAMKSAPHTRAPEVFAARDDALTLQLGATYRLGQATVDAIAPLYGFPFDSARPDRHLTRRDGTVLPELDSVQIEPAASIGDLGTLRTIADLAVSMVGTNVNYTDADGNAVSERVTERDVAVVVSRSAQASGIQAILRSLAYEGITVGTADKMQGGQWHAVVAVDPLVGQSTVGPHQVNKGRLCVMASRHQTHMTWVHDGQSIDKLQAAADEHPEAKVGIAVRRHLLASQA